MIRKSLSLTKIAVLSSLLIACSTSPISQQQEPVKGRRGGGHSGSIAKPVGQVTAKKAPVPVPIESEYSEFFERLSSADKDFTEKDRQAFLTFAPNPPAGTIHQAAIVVGILRDIVTPVGGQKTTFREMDLAAKQSAEGKDSTSVIETTPAKVEPSMIIESRCREKGVDCVAALANNPHLRTHAVYTLALEASRFEGNSPLFVQNLTAALKTEIQSWGDLAKKMGMDVQAVGSPVTESSPPTSNPEAPAVTVSPDENTAANQSLAKAIEYAGKEDLEKAIAEARKIKQGTDIYQTAQENLKTWANKVVQDLRRQAANQYRSSSGTNETIGKKSHLEKAKVFLEVAIAKYPEASTLETVKENLEIINNELGRLK
jgi:hypothetical protein